jgi:acetate---CoA ligase (ADP-forming)
MNLDTLLRPRSIAVLGASERPSIGRTLIESLERFGFPGAVYPINPKYGEILGKPCYASLADLPGDVDAVAFCVGHAHALEHVRLAAQRGVGAVVIFDGGFGEAGPEGRHTQDEIAGICREAGVALCGPNCMGVVNPHDRSMVYLQPLRDPASLPGNVGLVSQSGSICINLLADSRRFGWSHVISSGNEAVVDAAHFIEFLADDPETRVIATFTESVRDPERFVAALDRAADRGKPVVVLKAGKSERTRRAIASHTGGLAGESRAFSAVLRAHRAIEVSDLDEMTEVLAACQGERWPRGRRLFVMTASGGLAELILDLSGSAGVELPGLSPATRAEVERVVGPVSADGNPLDAWGHGDFARNFPHALAVVGQDPGFDAIALCNEGCDDQPIGSPARMLDYARILAEGAKASSKPFYFMTSRPGVFRRDQVAFLKEHGVPIICGTRQGLGAVDRLARWAEPLSPPRAAAAAPGLRLAELAAGRRRPTIHEHDAKRLLAAAGLPVAAERLVSTLDEARDAAAALGYPVVLKVVSDEIPHRAEHGLVAVALRDERDLALAWRRMSERLDALGKRGAADGFLVQEMIAGGVEVLAGVSRDPHFGLTMAFGAGGVLVEALDDVALRALPLRPGDARAMVAETRVARLLAGGRRPPSDVPALCGVLERIADLAWAEREQLAELDVNPILVRAEGRGCVVVDALVVPRADTQGA